MNYTKIKVILRDLSQLYVDADELVVFKLSGDYIRIEYLNDKHEWHRTDGPALEWVKGRKSWWVDGGRHRLDGPAVIDRNDVEWWVDGTNYSQEEFEREYGQLH